MDNNGWFINVDQGSHAIEKDDDGGYPVMTKRNPPEDCWARIVPEPHPIGKPLFLGVIPVIPDADPLLPRYAKKKHEYIL